MLDSPNDPPMAVPADSAPALGTIRVAIGLPVPGIGPDAHGDRPAEATTANRPYAHDLRM
jgi:hypothetical protein